MWIQQVLRESVGYCCFAPSTLIFYTSHHRSDPRSNPPNRVILCEIIKDVGNFKAKSGSWKLISYGTPSTSAIYELSDFLPNLCVGSNFRAKDSPRHVGNEGFRIFGERDRAIPEALPSRYVKAANWICSPDDNGIPI
ncbi:hypothetical protein ACFX13_037001 [Malus domestica]